MELRSPAKAGPVPAAGIVRRQPRTARRAGLGLVVLAATGLALSGCSLLDPKSRPDPAAENVRCALEYRPSAGGNDLLFLAWSSPYREEAFNLSLPDLLLHRVAAPGRHLTADARVEGASCSGPPWRQGFRLPAVPSSEKWLLCQRDGLEPVVFAVETRWGRCAQHIPGGDPTPRGDLSGLRSVKELPELGA